MGSVMEWVECPNCGQENCSSDFYYRTGEEYLNCNDCGYHHSVSIKKESREKPIRELVDDDYRITKLTNPWGAYRLKQKGCIGTECGSFADEQDYNHMLELVETHKDDIDEFSLSRLIDGKIVRILVYQSPQVIPEMN